MEDVDMRERERQKDRGGQDRAGESKRTWGKPALGWTWCLGSQGIDFQEHNSPSVRLHKMFPSSGLWIEREMPCSANQSSEREAWAIPKAAWWQKGIMSPCHSAGLLLTFGCHPLKGFRTKYSWLLDKPLNKDHPSLDVLKAVFVGQWFKKSLDIINYS